MMEDLVFDAQGMLGMREGIPYKNFAAEYRKEQVKHFMNTFDLSHNLYVPNFTTYGYLNRKSTAWV